MIVAVVALVVIVALVAVITSTSHERTEGTEEGNTAMFPDDTSLVGEAGNQQFMPGQGPG